jgi:hypothetical protein
VRRTLRAGQRGLRPLRGGPLLRRQLRQRPRQRLRGQPQQHRVGLRRLRPRVQPAQRHGGLRERRLRGRACNAGFGDCDGNPANGCETSLARSVAHCGRCGNACPSINGTATCAMGACALACNAGFGNCDGNPANGCETNLATTASSCGMCGRACALPNATAGCASGQCTVASCAAGFGNCDNNAANGCETNLNTTVAALRRVRPRVQPRQRDARLHGRPVRGGELHDGLRQLRRQPRQRLRGDCSGTCRNLSNTLGHCGACGRACTAPTGGTATCTNGTCNQSCPSGQANCNGTCRNLATDPQHCGACGMACAMGLVCAARVCACPSGQTLCSGACVDLRSNADHCGMCGVRCASGMCQAGACACPAGQTACGPSNDTCVDTQTDAQHCGGCGRACMAPTARCMGGMCVGG